MEVLLVNGILVTLPGVTEFAWKDGTYQAKCKKRGVIATFRDVEVCGWWVIRVHDGTSAIQSAVSVKAIVPDAAR